MIYGGPYRNRPKDLPGFCMAEELMDLPHDVAIPTRDFSVPEPEDMMKGLEKARYYLKKDGSLYVGCMGGIGRTGLFMGAMTLLSFMSQYWMPNQAALAVEAIKYVRDNYKGHAIETKQQEDFLKELPLKKMAFLIRLSRVLPFIK